MKKKIKLITTFASLGLALALMVFGVYAATSATFKIDGTVSFQASANVDAIVRVYESANNLAAPLDAAADSGWTQVDTDYTISYKTNTNPTGGKTFLLTNDALTVSNTGVAQYYCVKVTIQNISTNTANTLTITHTALDGSDSNVTVVDANTSVTATAGETATILITLSVTDVTNNATLDFNELLFTITAA